MRALGAKARTARPTLHSGIPAGMMVFRRYLCIKTSALRVNEADLGLDGVVKVENPGYLMLIKANLPGGIAERFCCF